MNGVDDKLADPEGSAYGALKDLRTKLIQNLGRTGKDTPLSLSQDLEKIFGEIKALKDQKGLISANQAELRKQLARGIDKGEAVSETTEFLNDIILDKNKLEDLEEIDSLRALVRSLLNKEEISSRKAVDRTDFSKLQQLFGIGGVDENEKPIKLVRSQILDYMEQANYAIGSRSHMFKTEILGYLDKASKNPGSEVVDIIQRLKVLHAESQINLVTAGLDQLSRAKRAFASIFNDLFNPIVSRRN